MTLSAGTEGQGRSASRASSGKESRSPEGFRPPVCLPAGETILRYARSTTKSTGLTMKAYLVRRDYRKGVKIADEQMEHLRLRAHDTQPTRSYTLRPR